MTGPAEAPAEEGYDGAAQIVTSAGVVDVVVTLRGQFQPIDGRYHWYGRVAVDDRVSALGAGATVLLRTPAGEAEGRLSDEDPWGRYRLEGTGRPPFDTVTE
jgi:hypothetical protein